MMTPMTPWMRAATVAALAASGAALLTACDWRAETPPIERRTPAPSTVQRDQAALREQAVIDAEGTGELADLEAALAPERMAALGGVYVATPSPSPSPSTSAAPRPALAEAVAQARDGALADAATTEDASLAALLRSIALSHALTLWVPHAVEGSVEERAVPDVGLSSGFTPGGASAVPVEALASAAVAHDRAGFVYETAAARETEDGRTAALARAALHRARAAALVAMPGVEDLRQELYTVDRAAFADAASRTALERELETSLGWNYAALLAEAAEEDAGWLLNAAFDAYAAAASLPGRTVGDVPALPGIASAP